MTKIYLESGDFVVLTSVTYCVGRARLTDPSIDDNAATLHWHSDDECYYEVHYEDKDGHSLMYYDKDEGPAYFDPSIDRG
jgi:hypothetical protein